MLYFRSLVFFLIMAVSAVLFAPLAVLTFPFPFKTRFKIISQWARFNMRCLELICGLRYEVDGHEHISGDSGIVFCKHQSMWETIALQEIFPPQTWVLKRELLWIPFFGWGLAMLQPVAINRAAGRAALQQLIEQGKARLGSGHWIVVFPEGTRMPPGKRRRFAFGGAKLAEASGHQVVPVAHNAGEFWRRRGFVKYPGVIKVKIGAPISTVGKSAAEINEAAERWIAAAMTEITGCVEEVIDRK